MSPLAFAFTFEYWLFFVLKAVAVGLEVWALADVLRRRPEDFLRTGGRDKSFWTLLTGVALVVGVLGLLTGRGLGMFSLAAACVASVYLAGPREQMGPAVR